MTYLCMAKYAQHGGLVRVTSGRGLSRVLLRINNYCLQLQSAGRSVDSCRSLLMAIHFTDFTDSHRDTSTASTWTNYGDTIHFK